MGFRFRRRIKIAPGVYINVGKSGITSATIGKAGASLNIGKKGTRATVGLPGTGISYTSGSVARVRKSKSDNDDVQQVDSERLGFFSDSTLLEDDDGDFQPVPPLPLRLTNSQYRKLSAEEKKVFKSAGGKVRLSAGEKVFILVVVLIGIGWLSDRHPVQKDSTQIKHETKHVASTK